MYSLNCIGCGIALHRSGVFIGTVCDNNELKFCLVRIFIFFITLRIFLYFVINITVRPSVWCLCVRVCMFIKFYKAPTHFLELNVSLCVYIFLTRFYIKLLIIRGNRENFVRSHLNSFYNEL